VYPVNEDFPHFGERLIGLQDFVLTQHPNDWKTLWLDRRDIARFWIVWAAIIFGILTLVLSLIQISLSAAQVVSGFKSG
jgi:hypothetical protein